MSIKTGLNPVQRVYTDCSAKVEPRLGSMYVDSLWQLKTKQHNQSTH